MGITGSATLRNLSHTARSGRFLSEDYPRFLKETLIGDVLKFVEDIIRGDESIIWTRLETMIADRYSNINRQKEVSDRLHSLIYTDFESYGENPATTDDRIIALIDKHATLALKPDQSDAAKVRFLSNATRGRNWTLHEEGPNLKLCLV